MACRHCKIRHMSAGLDMRVYLCSWEIVARGQRGRPSVQRRCAILLLCALGQVWEAEEARLLWLTLLLEVPGIHLR